MKPFFSEFLHSYESYSFGYCPYVVREPDDDISEIYEAGYLPYSGAKGVQNVYYMARSVRVALPRWEPNSENRRIQKRFDGLRAREISVDGFLSERKNALRFCIEYFLKRHGPNIMPKERLIYILENFVTNILEYRQEEKTTAYVFLAQDAKMSHFFYSFYDFGLINRSLGLWLMADALLRAKKSGQSYVYLGTAYGESGLYKTNFNALEYWDGRQWLPDVRKLKERCRSDKKRAVGHVDEWKSEITGKSFTHHAQKQKRGSAEDVD